MHDSALKAKAKEAKKAQISTGPKQESDAYQFVEDVLNEMEDATNWLSASGKKASKLEPYFAKQASIFWSEGLQTSKQGWSSAVKNGKDFTHLGSDEGSFQTASEKFSQASNSRFFTKAMPKLEFIGRLATGYGYADSIGKVLIVKDGERLKVAFEESGKLYGEKFGSRLGGVAGVAVLELVTRGRSTVPMVASAYVAGSVIGGAVGSAVGKAGEDFIYYEFKGDIEIVKHFYSQFSK